MLFPNFNLVRSCFWTKQIHFSFTSPLISPNVLAFTCLILVFRGLEGAYCSILFFSRLPSCWLIQTPPPQKKKKKKIQEGENAAFWPTCSFIIDFARSIVGGDVALRLQIRPGNAFCSTVRQVRTAKTTSSSRLSVYFQRICSGFLEIDFEIDISDKKSRLFDHSEVIFKCRLHLPTPTPTN